MPDIPFPTSSAPQAESGEGRVIDLYNASPQSSAIEVEITPEMIEAGANLLAGAGLVEFPRMKEVMREFALEIFETMLRQSSSHCRKHP